MIKALKEDITIRNFHQEDIKPLVAYWTNNSEEYWKARGINKNNLYSESEFTDYYQKTLEEFGDIKTIAVIVFKGSAVGIHSLTDLINEESAVFHAHIWNEEHRHIGIGSISYLKASEFFLKKLNLKKIFFKTPKINIAANKLKEKLGIPCIGETIFESPVLIHPLEANLYEVDDKILQEIASAILT